MQISKATIHRSFCDIVHLPKYFLLAWSLLKSSDTSNSYSEVTHKSSIFSSGIIGIYTTMHSKESLFCQNAVLDGYYVWLTKHFVPEFNFSHFEFRINSLNLNLWLRFWRKFKGEVFQHSSIQVAALNILRIFTIVDVLLIIIGLSQTWFICTYRNCSIVQSYEQSPTCSMII